MLMMALGTKGMAVTGVTRGGGRTGVQMGFYISLDDGKDLFGGIPGFQIVPDTNGKL